MAIPDIKFSIVAGGVDKVMNDLKSISRAVEVTYNQIERQTRKTNSQLVRFEEEKTRQILNLHKKMIDGMSHNASEGARRQARIAKETVDRIEREYRRLNNVNVRPGGSMAKFGAGHGQYNQGMSNSGIRLSSNGASASGLVGLEAGAGGMGAALGVGVFISAVSTAFSAAANVIKSGASYLADSLISAATQIGGGKGLGDIFVERANIERGAATMGAMRGISPSERMTKTELLDAVSFARRGTPFEAEDVMGGIKSYQAVSGRLRSAFDVAPDVLQISRLNNLTATQGFGIFGTLAAQHPNLSQDQVAQVMRNMHRLGQTGAVELHDVSNIGRATELAGQLGAGNVVGGLGIEYGMVQAAKQGGAPSPAIAAGRLQDYLLKNMPEETAIDTKTGQRFFPNFGKSLANLYGRTKGGTEFLPGMERSRQVLTGIREQVMSEHPGASMEQQKKAVEDLVDTWSKMNVTSKELNDEYKDAVDNIKDKLIISFNDLYEKLKNDVGPLFDTFTKQLMTFIGSVKPEDLKKVTDSLINLFGSMIEAMPSIIDAFTTLGKIVLMATKGVWYWAEALSYATAPGWAIRGFSDLGKDLDAMGDVIDKSRDSYDKVSDAAKKTAETFNAVRTGTTTAAPIITQVSTPVINRPPTATMHAAPVFGGNDRENVRWMRQLVRTSLEGNELVKEQNRKLDNMNTTDPSRSGQTNK